jgi:hypothetical protein
MVPPKRTNVRQEMIGDVMTLPPQCLHRVFDVDGILEDDSGDDEVQPVGPVILVLECSIPDLPETVQEHGPLEGITGFADIETAEIPPPQVRVLDPVQSKERALQAPDFPQGNRQAVLTGISGKLAHYM